MRHGLRSLRAESAASSYHPLQNRLEHWDETTRNWKNTMQRNAFGLGMPMRMEMERRMVAASPHMPARRVANVHLDVLDGRDETLDPSDFLPCTSPCDLLTQRASKARLAISTRRWSAALACENYRVAGGACVWRSLPAHRATMRARGARRASTPASARSYTSKYGFCASTSSSSHGRTDASDATVQPTGRRRKHT